MANVSRRQLIQLAATSIALVGLPRVVWGRLSWEHAPFSMGVASGSPTSDSIVLWTRLDPHALEAAGLSQQAVPVRWQLAQDEKFSDILAQGVIQATPALGHSIHAEVSALQPDHHYFYRFICGSATSTTGRTKTFPHAGDASVKRLRLAYASCQQWGNGYFNAYRHMLDENLDLVMFLGDYIYEYPVSRPKDIRPTTGGWVTTLEDYRKRYALHKSDPDLQAIHAAVPWISTWDDHEVQNDYAGTRRGDPGKSVPGFLTRRRAAYQAYYENMPVRFAYFASLITERAENSRVFSSTPYGRLATLYMLDNRQYRDPQVCNPNERAGASRVDPRNCPALNQPQRTMLGEEQEGWLARQFDESRGQWNVIGQQTVFGRRNMDASGGEKFSNDGWDGYPQARQRLIDAMIKSKLSNPVVLGGDVHENWVGHILADYNQPLSKPVGVEFCGTSITSPSNRKAETVQKMLRVNPHFIFADAQHRGYGVVQLTPTNLTTTLRVVEDITVPQSGIKTLAQFSVVSGQPVVHKI